MVKAIKRFLIRLLTANPYRIVQFNELCQNVIGSPIDSAETLDGILYEERGSLVYYNGFPNTFNQTFNLKKIGKKSRYLQIGLFSEPNRLIYSMEDTNIYGSLGIIYNAQKRAFIEESTKEWLINLKNSNYTNIYKLPQSNQLPGISLSCLSNGADGGYYHFIHEVLPKLWFCRNMIPYTDNIFFNGPPVSWKLKWLNFFNVDINRIIWIGPYDNYNCKQLLFSSRIINDQQINHYSILALKALIGNRTIQIPDQNKVLYISRAGESERDLKWENELLQQYPYFKKINARNLSVEDTINHFASASLVIAAHGAGLSNLFLCHPGTKVLELYPDLDHYQPCYTRISDICKLKHYVAAIDFNQKANKTMGIDFLTSIINTLLVKN